MNANDEVSKSPLVNDLGTMEFYDSLWANDWHDMERYNPTARHLERMIVKVLKSLGQNNTLIDVGCGMGVNLKRIQRNFPALNLAGTDISPKGIELARHYVGSAGKVEYHILDVEKATLARQFDVVLCSQVLEHIQDDRAALAHLVSMTGKYLLLTVPSGNYNSTSKLVGHFRHYSKAELVEKVSASGMQVLWAVNWGFPFHSIYKFLLNQLPEKSQKAVGLGKYGFGKRMISNFLFGIFYLNRFNQGSNVILLATKDTKPAATKSLGGICPNCDCSGMTNQFTAYDWSSSDSFQLWKCENCGMGVTLPRPSDVSRYYPENYRHFNPLISFLMKRMYRRRVRSWQKHLPQKGTALEIGCGNGWMLEALKDHGWEVVGFERDENIAKRISEAFKVPIYSGELQQMGNRKFELILMFNVIEHLADPFLTLKRCSEMLAPGGTLILSTQNLASLQAKLSGKNWSHLDVPRHLFHFSKSSFDILFAKNDLANIRTSTISWIHDPYGWIVSVQNQLGFEKDYLTVSLMGRDFSKFTSVQGILVVLSTGLLALPAVLLSIFTWMAGNGGLIEVWARRKK